jgi:hypothetical protein
MQRLISRQRFLKLFTGTSLGLAASQLGRFWGNDRALAQIPKINRSPQGKQRLSPIWLENQYPGTIDWKITQSAGDREIEGYASATSVNLGETLQFFVSTTAANYQLEIFRLGWYGGRGARSRTDVVQLPGKLQPMPMPQGDTGLIECQWQRSYSLTVPAKTGTEKWTSGLYVAKLTAATGGQSYIPFIVRDDAKQAALLFQASVTTWQAYNNWGGKSLYAFNSTDQQEAFQVSFNRPYGGGGDGGASLTDPFQGWELNMLRYLEREGFDVNYCTNLDTHKNIGNLMQRHRAFLSVGHDEYWSWEMRRNVEAGRDRGMNLAFFSANTCYWQIRLESSMIDNAPHRTITCYRYNYERDPVYSDPARQRLTTTTWRSAPVNRPENALLGVMYDFYPVDSDIVITQPDHWIFAKTGLRQGDKLIGLLGYEADRVFDNGQSPANLVTLAASPAGREDGSTGLANMTYHVAPSGAQVFAAGTIQLPWGLDNYYAGITHPNLVNPQVQRMVRNILYRFSRAAA